MFDCTCKSTFTVSSESFVWPNTGKKSFDNLQIFDNDDDDADEVKSIYNVRYQSLVIDFFHLTNIDRY